MSNEHQDGEPAALQLNDGLDRARQEIRRLQDCLEAKNRALDALHFVWCSGGCKTGTHRWTEQNITEAIVAEAEQNTRRLRTWFEANKHKRSNAKLSGPNGPQEKQR